MTYLPPVSRASDGYTSHAAEAAIDAEGSRQRIKAIVLAAIKAHPGSTTSEIAEWTGLPEPAVWRRKSDLKNTGEIYYDGRKPGASGKLQSCLWPVLPEPTQGKML